MNDMVRSSFCWSGLCCLFVSVARPTHVGNRKVVHPSLVMLRVPEMGLLPPATGVTVRAAALPAGLMILRTWPAHRELETVGGGSGPHRVYRLRVGPGDGVRGEVVRGDGVQDGGVVHRDPGERAGEGGLEDARVLG